MDITLKKDDSSIFETKEKIDLVKKVLNGDSYAKNLFYMQYEKMVKKIVYDFFYKKGQGVEGSILEMEDYEQEVWTYLFENIHKYSPERSMISTYIYLMSNACLRRYKENNSRQMRLPVYKVQLFNRMKRFSNDFEIENGILPNETILMREFNIANKDIIQFYEYSTVLTSLEQNFNDSEDNCTLYNVLESKENTEKEGMSNVLFDEMKDKIFNSSSLKAEQKTIVELWLFKDTPDKEICELLDIKKSNLIYEKDKIKRYLQKLLVQYKKELL